MDHSSLRISLKAARVSANLSQKEAASALEINVATLQNYEKGLSEPKWNTVKRTETLSEISADNLFLSRKPA